MERLMFAVWVIPNSCGIVECAVHKQSCGVWNDGQGGSQYHRNVASLQHFYIPVVSSCLTGAVPHPSAQGTLSLLSPNSDKRWSSIKLSWSCLCCCFCQICVWQWCEQLSILRLMWHQFFVWIFNSWGILLQSHYQLWHSLLPSFQIGCQINLCFRVETFKRFFCNMCSCYLNSDLWRLSTIISGLLALLTFSVSKAHHIV